MPKRKAAVKKQKLDRPSVKEQIEATPRIATHEMAWTKDPGKRLEKAAFSRRKDSVRFNPFKLKKKQRIHTHPDSLRRYGSAFPSDADIRNIKVTVKLALEFSKHSKKWIVPAHTISCTNKKGKEIGRTIIRPTTKAKMKIVETALMGENAKKKLIERLNSLERELNNQTEQHYNHQQEAFKALVTLPEYTETSAEKKLFNKKLKEVEKRIGEIQQTNKKVRATLEDLGFKLRFIPMKGYKYNPYMMCFEEKR